MFCCNVIVSRHVSPHVEPRMLFPSQGPAYHQLRIAIIIAQLHLVSPLVFEMLSKALSAAITLACFRRVVQSRPHHPPRVLSKITSARCFSMTSSCRIMEISGFTESQLDVREAISKICSKYPDVRVLPPCANR